MSTLQWMQPGARIKASVKRAIRWAGYDIRRIDDSSTMEAALRRVSAALTISTVIDIGASDGRWSEVAMRYYPRAEYLLFEAQATVHEASLKEMASRHARLHYVLAAAGDHDGTIHFDASDAFGGAASERAFEQHDRLVPMTTVDAEVEHLQLEGPFLLKLDTHGFEREVLQGATDVLTRTALLIVEAYNFELRSGSLRFHELCGHLDGLGFRTVDVVDTLRRPSDGFLWQFDLVFARHDRPEFESNSYGPIG